MGPRGPPCEIRLRRPRRDLRIVLAGPSVVIAVEPVRIAVGVMPIEEALGSCLGGKVGAIPIAKRGGGLSCGGHRRGSGENRNYEPATANR